MSNSNIIEIRPQGEGWAVFEGSVTAPVFPRIEQAIGYASRRRYMLQCEVAVKDAAGNTALAIPFVKSPSQWA